MENRDRSPLQLSAAHAAAAGFSPSAFVFPVLRYNLYYILIIQSKRHCLLCDLLVLCNRSISSFRLIFYRFHILHKNSPGSSLPYNSTPPVQLLGIPSTVDCASVAKKSEAVYPGFKFSVVLLYEVVVVVVVV